MPDYLPKFSGSNPITFGVTADVTGGRLVSVTGARVVGPAPADSPAVLGVAAFDAPLGDNVSVWPRPNGVHRLMASAQIASGDRVASGPNGMVKTASVAGTSIGTALTAATAGTLVEVLFGGSL